MTGWIIPAAIACILSVAMTGALIRHLTKRAIMDLPNDRSLHDIPKPRGGGWAILGAFTIGLLLLQPQMADIKAAWPLIAGTILLVAISWLDDLKNLSALPRFGTQIVAVALGLMTLHGGVFQGWLPPVADYTLTAIGWLWFVNLFNFMDGMDGLAGGEAVAIGIGLFLLAPHAGAEIVLASAVLGFLVWNWAPSRIILGDIGSIPLGYILGAFLLTHAEQGQWAAALLLPLYFLIDATCTLLKRAARGEKIWQAHRQHFYQHAVLSGRKHSTVAIAVYLTNAALIFCAVVLAGDYPLRAIGIGVLSVALLIVWMRSRPKLVAA
jgi:UDP-N-acetylmuramyl pentapeptide phosphotransferase/UDP-N-acetylglucosamine-1-phosphate transferase